MLLGFIEFVESIEFIGFNSNNTATPQHFVTQHVNLNNSLTY